MTTAKLHSPDISSGYCQCGCGEKTKLAIKTQHSRGWLKGQPVKYIHGHNSYRTDPIWVEEDRGYQTPCWIWQRSLTTNGYPQQTRSGKSTLAHRIVYEEQIRQIPKGMQLHHLCETPECVCPYHMHPMTVAQHMRTRRSTKLTEKKVQEMRHIYAAGGYTYEALGREFGVTTQTAWYAVKGNTWKEI